MNDSEAESVAPPWVRGLTIPSALLGLLAFFLPWIEFSCGPVHLNLSGYEIASGNYADKMEAFRRGMGGDLAAGPALRREPNPGKNAREDRSSPEDSARGGSDSLLWLVPGSFVLLLALAVLGLPQRATIIILGVAATYLAYFGVVTEQQVSDPRVTEGILDHHWLIGFWATWVALVVPTVVAILKPKDR